jgi:hypothetical protein
MMDIITSDEGKDLGLYNTQTTKAKNIVSVQLYSLEYALNLGVDLKYFLTEGVEFQNESFKSYLVQTLANNGINVQSVNEVMGALSSVLEFNLSPEKNDSGMIAG